MVDDGNTLPFRESHLRQQFSCFIRGKNPARSFAKIHNHHLRPQCNKEIWQEQQPCSCRSSETWLCGFVYNPILFRDFGGLSVSLFKDVNADIPGNGRSCAGLSGLRVIIIMKYRILPCLDVRLSIIRRTGPENRMWDWDPEHIH